MVSLPIGQVWAKHRRRVLNVAALVAPLCLATVFVPFRATFTNVAAALSMVALIEALAILGTRVTGALATLSAAVWFDFFLTAPFEHLSINRRLDIEITLSIVVIGAIVTEFAARSNHHRRAADEEAHFISILRDMAVMSSRNERRMLLVEHATRSLTQILELRGCRFDPLVTEPPLARIQPGGEVRHVGLRWPVGEMGLPGPQCEILCLDRGAQVGRFVLTPTPGLALSSERLEMAVVLVGLFAPNVRETSEPGSQP